MKQPMKIRLLSTLENLLGMYEYASTEVLVLEAVANGIDAGADAISIRLERDTDGDYVEFHNNGRSMSRSDFANYHTVSYSTKQKGEGIGFAGVGAKIFMAAWEHAEIVTMSGEGDQILVSRMWRERPRDGEDEVVWESNLDGATMGDVVGVRIANHRPGTTYRVKIRYEDYTWLKRHLVERLQFWFNMALVSKRLSLTANGAAVSPWTPGGSQYRKMPKYQSHSIPCRVWIANDDIPDEWRHITYYVLGKRIKSDMVDWVAEIKPQYAKRVFCMADASALAGYLTTNKENFERNFYTNKMLSRAKRAFYETLKENGCLRDPVREVDDSPVVRNELTRRLNVVLNLPELRQFNPFAKAIRLNQPVGSKEDETTGSALRHVSIPDSKDTGSESIDGPKEKRDDSPAAQMLDGRGESGEVRRRRTGGISIIPVDAPDDDREGWLDPTNGAVVYNTGHAFYKRIKPNRALDEYNLARVVIASLIKAKNEEIPMDAVATLKHFEDILHRVWL